MNRCLYLIGYSTMPTFRTRHTSEFPVGVEYMEEDVGMANVNLGAFPHINPSRGNLENAVQGHL